MTGRPSQFPRWVYPLVPFVAVAGASGLVAVTRFLRARAAAQPARSRRILLTSVSAALWHRPRAARMARGNRVQSASDTPTHALVEAWLQENTSPGDVVLLEIHWLKLEESKLRIKRVEELPVVLKGGLYQLFANNWVVVPEPYFGNPALRRLSFVRRFHADQSAWGGNMGYDFEVYAAPKAPPSIAGADVALDTPEAAPFLGDEWRPDDSGAPGLRLPPGGASLFLPAVARPSIDIELEVMRARRLRPRRSRSSWAALLSFCRRGHRGSRAGECWPAPCPSIRRRGGLNFGSSAAIARTRSGSSGCASGERTFASGGV